MALELQDSLRILTLVVDTKGVPMKAQYILLEKLLSIRVFHHFMVAKIVSKTWRTSAKVHIEKLKDSLFKFTFEKEEDMKCIF